MVLTVAVPGLASRAAVIVAVNAVTLLLVSSVMLVWHGAVDAPELELRGQVLPFHCTLVWRSEEHTSELQSQSNLVCRLLLEKKKRAPELRGSCAWRRGHRNPPAHSWPLPASTR